MFSRAAICVLLLVFNGTSARGNSALSIHLDKVEKQDIVVIDQTHKADSGIKIDIELINKSGSAIRINSVQSSCSCTAITSWPKIIKTGEPGKLQIEVNPSKTSATTLFTLLFSIENGDLGKEVRLVSITVQRAKSVIAHPTILNLGTIRDINNAIGEVSITAPYIDLEKDIKITHGDGIERVVLDADNGNGVLTVKYSASSISGGGTRDVIKILKLTGEVLVEIPVIAFYPKQFISSPANIFISMPSEKNKSTKGKIKIISIEPQAAGKWKIHSVQSALKNMSFTIDESGKAILWKFSAEGSTDSFSGSIIVVIERDSERKDTLRISCVGSPSVITTL